LERLDDRAFVVAGGIIALALLGGGTAAKTSS